MNNMFDKSALAAMIQDVNQNTVEVEDQMSDHPHWLL